MEETEDLSTNELEKLEEVELEIEPSASEVNEGYCGECNEKLIRTVENISLLDGAISFHIIKLKCPKCGKVYLDLDQAKKHDFLLALKKALNQPLEKLTKKINN